MKQWKQKLATYVYNHYNICNILIYFCNIRVKHLYTSKAFEIFETYAGNMQFQCNISVPLGEEKLIGYGVHRCRARR